MNWKDLQKLSQIRIKEAKSLFKAGFYSGSYYLAGYAVECALKACIAKSTERHDFPDKDRVQKSYSHNLTELARIAGLDAELAKAGQSNPKLGASWDLAKNWLETSRYALKSKNEAQAILDAVGKRKDGLLSWITQRW